MKSLEKLREDWETTLFDAREKFGWSTFFIKNAIWDILLDTYSKDEWPEDYPPRYSSAPHSSDDGHTFCVELAKQYSITDYLVQLNKQITWHYGVPRKFHDPELKHLIAAGLTTVECVSIASGAETVGKRLAMYSQADILKMSCFVWPHLQNVTILEMLRHCRRWDWTEYDTVDDIPMTVESMFGCKEIGFRSRASGSTVVRNATLALELGFSAENCVFIAELVDRKPEILKNLQNQKRSIGQLIKLIK